MSKNEDEKSGGMHPRLCAGGSKEGPVTLKIGKIIANRWRVVSKIGEGGCGSVYKVEDTNTKIEAAMKVESNNVPGGSVLKLEVTVLRRLAGKAHVCQLLHSGKKEDYCYMVMTLLGQSLNHLSKKCGKQLSVSTQIRVGVNVLYGLKQLHDIGFVHRDIKPANLAVGPENVPSSHFVHILDFGLSREYAVGSPSTGYAIRRPRQRCLFRGTTRYCSLNTHDKGEQGRVDDLWSLLYMMAEMRGALPWATCRDKKETAEVKRSTADKMLLYNCPVQLLDFAEHLRTLNYYVRPDYKKLFDILCEVMKDGGFCFTDPYDWERSLTKRLRDKSREKMRSSHENPLLAPSGERVAGSREIVNDAMPSTFAGAVSSKEAYDPGFGPLPQANYNDPANPFPPEDFETNPLGL